MKPLVFALFLVLLAASARGHFGDMGPVPENAKVSLLLPKTTCLLGDDILMTFRLENVGTTDFSYNIGGDYRGTGFPLRCRVIVKNSTGKQMFNKATHAPFFGGMMQTRILKPGEKFDQELPLLGYADIPASGRYTISVVHDFGWEETPERKFPVAMATLDIAGPTAKEASDRVSNLLSEMKSDGKPDLTKEWKLQNELARLANPIFLPALKLQAETGKSLAVKGIESIETKEATAALVGLLSNPHPEVAIAAAKALIPRLPDPQNNQDGLTATPLSLTWDAKFEAPTHQEALNCLKSDNENLVTGGASIIRAIGKPDDLPDIAAALQIALDRPQEPRKSRADDILDEPGAQRPLLAAVDALRARGARSDGIGGTAFILIYFRQLADPAIPRQERQGWRDSVEAFATQNPATLRQAALRAIPTPFTDDKWVSIVSNAMEDQDLGVEMTACQVAEKTGNPNLIAPLLRTLEITPSEWVARAASNAAWKLGARIDLWDVWARKLVDKSFLMDAGNSLFHVIAEVDSGQTGGAACNSNFTREQAFAFRNIWLKFLHEHRKQLAEGKRYSYKDPIIRPLMGNTPDGGSIFTFTFKNGTQWPERIK